jgi:hypothetical protein
MHLRLTDFGILTMAVVAASIWMAFIRSKLPEESNWPLVYWGFLIAYLGWVEDVFYPYVIYFGLFLALIIRFEFLSPSFIKVFNVFEYLCWAYVVIAGLGYVLS